MYFVKLLYSIKTESTGAAELFGLSGAGILIFDGAICIIPHLTSAAAMIGASFSALSRQEGCTASHPPALGDLRFQIKDDVLQPLKKPPRVRSVHLRVMELKGQPERCFEKTSAVSALDDKGVVENAAVHTDGTVDLGIDYRRGAYDHAVGQVVICAAFRRFAGQKQIIGVESRKAVGKRYIAGADLACPVFYDGIHRDRIVFQKFMSDGEQVKLFDPACRLSDAPAHEHIEFKAAPAGVPHKRCDIERFEKSHHRVRCAHPKVECRRAGRAFRVNGGRLHDSSPAVPTAYRLLMCMFIRPSRDYYLIKILAISMVAIFITAPPDVI